MNKENLLYAKINASENEMINAAKEAAHDFILQFENGYDTAVGERGMQISETKNNYTKSNFKNLNSNIG